MLGAGWSIRFLHPEYLSVAHKFTRKYFEAIFKMLSRKFKTADIRGKKRSERTDSRTHRKVSLKFNHHHKFELYFLTRMITLFKLSYIIYM